MMDEFGYVIASKYRTKIVKALKGKQIKIPTMLANETEIRTHHISSTLKDLRDHEIVECLNPRARKGRLYRLTEMGEEIAALIE